MSEQELQAAEDSVEPTGSESAPDSEGQHEAKATEDGEKSVPQSKVDEIIREKTFKHRQKEREIEEQLAAERKAREELEKKVSPQTRPEIPPPPDPYDDDYEVRIAERDEAIRQAEAYNYAQSQREREERFTQEQRQAEEAKSLQSEIEAYNERIGKLGVDPEKLQQAGQVIAAYGIDPRIARRIIQSEAGPLVTLNLFQNIDQLDAMSRGSYETQLETVIKLEASALSAKTTDAPPPVDNLEGGGAPPRKRGPKGLIIE